MATSSLNASINKEIRTVSLSVQTEEQNELRWLWHPGENNSQISRTKLNAGRKLTSLRSDVHLSEVDNTIVSSLISKYRGAAYSTSDLDLIEVEQLQSTTLAEIDGLEEKSRRKILAIETLCRELLEIDDTITSKRRELNSLRSPISRLPTEILSSVFEVLVSLEQGRFRIQHCLMRVCKLWKFLVLGNLTLWRTFKVVFPSHSHRMDTLDSEYSKLSTGLPIVMDRIGNRLPFNLIVVDQNPEDGDESDDDSDDSAPALQAPHWHAQVVDLCLRNINRYRTLSLFVRDPIWIEKILQLGLEQCSQLVSLNIEYSGRLSDNDPIISFQHAPQLSRFAIKWPSSSVLTKLELPFPQIEALFCDISESQERRADLAPAWKALLLRCPNIRSAKVQFSLQGNSSPEQQLAMSVAKPMAALTTLEHLDVSSTFDLTLEELTSRMEFRSLKTLRLSAQSGAFTLAHMNTPTTSYVEQNATLFCSLTRLSLMRFTIPEADLFTLLSNLHLLTDLELLYGVFGRGNTEENIFYVQDKRILEFLTVPESVLNRDSSGKPVLPLLRSVCLYDGQSNRGIYPGTQHLARMAISRYRWAAQQSQECVLSRASDEKEAQRSFEGSPFQLVLRVDSMRFRMVRRRMEDAIGLLHSRLFRAEPQISDRSTL